MPSVYLQRSAGFTLIELAVVVLVIALLLGSLLVPVSAQVEQRRLTETKKRLDEARQALLGFAIANGRFPCPATDTGNGVEAFASGHTAATGGCLRPNNGFLPGITLGLTNVDDQGFVLDAWGNKGNRLRYAVSNRNVPKVDKVSSTNCSTTPLDCVANVYTSTGGMRAAGMTNLSSAASTTHDIYVCSRAPTAVAATSCDVSTPPNDLAAGNVVFVLISTGKNGPTIDTELGNDERANQNVGDQVYVSKVQTDEKGTAPNLTYFDDIVIWASRNEVFSRMVAAGQLP